MAKIEYNVKMTEKSFTERLFRNMCILEKINPREVFNEAMRSKYIINRGVDKGMAIYDINNTAVITGICANYENKVMIIGDKRKFNVTKSKIEKDLECFELEESKEQEE